MGKILASFNSEHEHGYVVIQVSSMGLSKSEAKQLREEIVEVVGKLKRNRRNDNEPNLPFFTSFNSK